MASRIKGITVEIGGDTSGLGKALSDVNNFIKKPQSQIPLPVRQRNCHGRRLFGGCFDLPLSGAISLFSFCWNPW